MSVYACSDLHAQYNLWVKIKAFLKPDDILYNLGDTVDRGSCELDILYESLEDPNVILLRGNHEDFINSIGSEVMLALDHDENIYWTVQNIFLWEANGAEKTIEAFIELPREKKKWLINKIKKLPTHIEYINKKGEIIYLCHAGRQPITKEIQDMHLGKIPTNNYIWDRKHINQKHWMGKDNEYCVHGHTPIISMHRYIDIDSNPPIVNSKIYKYCDEHKINIDLGSFITHRACLLNLDTFEEIYFEDKNYEDEQD